MPRLFVVLLSMVVALNAYAAASEGDKSIASTIIDKLKSGRSDLEYDVLGKAPVDGFYQVQVRGGPVLYVSADGNFFFDGTLYQVKNGQFADVRDLRLDVDRRQTFATMPTDSMIIFKPEGRTKAIINVFTDVDCGYCRKLHKEVSQLNAMGIEVRYLAYPRSGIPSASYDKMATVWCSDNRKDSLTRSKNGDDDVISVCNNNPVAEHFALGGKLGVTGTPAIVLMDGTMVPGYRTAADFSRLLGLKSEAQGT
ncbi:MAG: DsbC family protein [Porticoccaceae bacterium]|nr:DsbC family protein [Porticoccaceae bacterium]